MSPRGPTPRGCRSLVEEVEGLALGPLGIDDRRGAEAELAGRPGDRGRPDLTTDVGARDADRGPVRDRVGAGVVVRRRDDTALERTHLQVVGARGEVVARVVHRLRARERVAVDEQTARRAVEIERDVVRGHVLGGDGVDGGVPLDNGDIVHRPAARGRDRPREGSACDRARGAREDGDHETGHR